MAINYTPSINIQRDAQKDFAYLPTLNAQKVASQIASDFNKGLRAFTIVGSYGTGKSAFLLAFEQSLAGAKRSLDIDIDLRGRIEFVNIVGSYGSVIGEFADQFGVNVNKNRNEFILSEIFNRYVDLGEGGTLFLVIDEFGKFLEFAATHEPEREMYFLQQLAEFCNNSKHRIGLITTLHQSFEAYAFSLAGAQKQEWVKVKGRFREITFNEPVEQMLHLAAEYMKRESNDPANRVRVNELLQLTTRTKAFAFNETFLSLVAPHLYPLDPLSAGVLTLAMQRYGQNERSLFSFLESTDESGLTKFDRTANPFYNLACVHDYLTYNFYSFLASKYNPDFAAWSSMRSSLDQVERIFPSSVIEYSKAVKCIGLLNIFAAGGFVLDRDFLADYLHLACGVQNAQAIVDELEKKRIIYFRQHSQRFILFEGTDLDIQTALFAAGNKISDVRDVSTLLRQYFTFQPVFARQYSYERGTPR